MRHKVEATAEQVTQAPVSSLGHRIWRCHAEWMTKLRNTWAAPGDLMTTSQCNVEGHPAWEKGTAAQGKQAGEECCERSLLQLCRRA